MKNEATKTTKHGYNLIASKIDKYDTCIALIDRHTSICSFVVAWDYNEGRDDWGQGHYFDNEAAARKKYRSYK